MQNITFHKFFLCAVDTYGYFKLKLKSANLIMNTSDFLKTHLVDPVALGITVLNKRCL